jgi:nucleoside 2-deoxyribosyltransferase
VLNKSAFQVYLAGPISGLTYDGAESWREDAKALLEPHGIKTLSPLRGKDYLKAIGVIDQIGVAYESMGVLSTSRGVITRDRYDATRCDVLLVNLLGAQRVSIGTMFEVAWSDLKRVPVVVMMEREGNIHDHMMLREMTGYQVESLEAAAHVIRMIAGQ